MIREAFQGRTIFLTGATGFLGKSVLEKILRSIPDVGTIYLLVRGKKGTDPRQRLRAEIIESPIFNRLKQEIGNEAFDRLVSEKLVALGGDVTMGETMGMSDEDVDRFIDNVQIIIHCAATINFHEKIKVAAQMNIVGPLNLLNLAKRCRGVLGYVHVSTAYVNCPRHGQKVMEKLYPLGFDPEQMLTTILQMDDATAELNTTKLIGAWPNTYTFTKAIAEHLLALNRGNLPVSIVRPSIIGAALHEPVPGWVDSVSAAGAMYLYCGLGVLQLFPAVPQYVADQVPVDLVSNTILAVVPSLIASDNAGFAVYHSATSSVQEPLTWSTARDETVSYWRRNPSKRMISPPNMTFYENNLVYHTQFFIRYELPSLLLATYSKALGTQAQKHQAQQMAKLVDRCKFFYKSFTYFVKNQWFFQNQNVMAVMNALPEEDKNDFLVDPAVINWRHYLHYYYYGLQTFVLKEDVPSPAAWLKDDSLLLRSEEKFRGNTGLIPFARAFSDITWAYNAGRIPSAIPFCRSPEEIKAIVMRTHSVQSVIKKVAQDEGIAVAKVEAKAAAILKKMSTDIQMPSVRLFGWFLRKLWRKLYYCITVNESALEALRPLAGKVPLVLLPTHRSYVDFLILSYIFFSYDLPIPHIAAGEDFLGIPLVSALLRQAGAFFMRRSFRDDPLYVSLFAEYVRTIVCDRGGGPLEFFLEGTRSRSGKLLHPKMGLLSIVTGCYLDRRVEDVHLVPITISYEATLEANLFPGELLGAPKVRESMSALLKARSVLKHNFGKIHVTISQPISLAKYTEDHAKALTVADPNITFDPFTRLDQRKQLIRSLAYNIVMEFNKESVCTSTAIVSALVLTFRQGISKARLLSMIPWIRAEILSRDGCLAGVEGREDDKGVATERALKLIENLVQERKGMIEPQPSDRILLLAYYRNRLIHLFVQEGIVACTLASLGGGQVQRSALTTECKFLKSLLNEEFVYSANPDTPDDWDRVIDSMIKRGYLVGDGDLISVGTGQLPNCSVPLIGNYSKPTAAEMMLFLSGLFFPFIESYWVGCMTLGYLSEETPETDLLLRMQWLAQKLYEEGKLHYHESRAVDILRNSLSLFKQWGVLGRKKPAEVVENKDPATAAAAAAASASEDDDEVVRLMPPYDNIANLQGLLHRIAKFRGPLSTWFGHSPVRHKALMMAKL